MCMFFNTASGCRKGDACPFLHVKMTPTAAARRSARHRRKPRAAAQRSRQRREAAMDALLAKAGVVPVKSDQQQGGAAVSAEGDALEEGDEVGDVELTGEPSSTASKALKPPGLPESLRFGHKRR